MTLRRMPSAPVLTRSRALIGAVVCLSSMTAAVSAQSDAPFQGEPDAAVEPNAGMSVSVSEYMTVDIFVQDEELANVLQMLSVQSRRNIVASSDVSATVTANLYGVTFYEALDSILNVNGYGYVERGNFIYVHTLEELAVIQEQERVIESKVIQLNYLNANDAAEFVTPLLSEVGQIKTNGDAGDFNLPEDTPTGSEQFALAATLVVYDYPEHIEEIEELLRQLDTRPSQVLVEATILQTEITEANAFGVDFSILNDVDFTDFIGLGGPLGAASALVNGDAGFAPADNRASAFTSTPGNTSGPATFRLGVVESNVSVFLRALDEISDVTILSTPKLLTLNRQPARVLVGRKLGFLNTTSTQTSTTQTVEFLDTGTMLSFRPFISNDGNIRLELKPRVSEGVIRSATDATGAAVTIPDEITQEITTNLIVRDGSTVVLGGLFRESTSLSRSQVPVLGDIPLIGSAFRGHDDDTTRSEIIFMIKPTIVNDQILSEQGERAINHAERLRVGSRQGLLPFSRERQTARLNLAAQDLAREGDTEKAIWNIRRSLELSPQQPGAYEMLERLTQGRTKWPVRSAIEQITDGFIDEFLAHDDPDDPDASRVLMKESDIIDFLMVPIKPEDEVTVFLEDDEETAPEQVVEFDLIAYVQRFIAPWPVVKQNQIATVDDLYELND